MNVDKPVSDEVVSSLREGIRFEKEGITTQPAIVDLHEPNIVRLTIYEGTHHQVKRMFARFDIRVTALHRESIGPYHLTAELLSGAYSTFIPKDASQEK